MTLASVSFPTLLQTMARDIVGAYALFNRAVTVLGLSNNQIITQIRNDVDRAVVILLDSSEGSTTLPAACITILDGIGINLATFRSNITVFNPPSGC